MRLEKEEIERELTEYLRKTISINITEQAWKVMKQMSHTNIEELCTFLEREKNVFGGELMFKYLVLAGGKKDG